MKSKLKFLKIIKPKREAKLRKPLIILLLAMASLTTPTATAEEEVSSLPSLITAESSTPPSVKVEIQITEEEEAALEQFKDANKATKTSPLFVSDLVLDMSNADEIISFLQDLSEVATDKELWEMLAKIPVVNGVSGRGHFINRIIKQLNEWGLLNSKLGSKSQSSLNKADWTEIKNAVAIVFSNTGVSLGKGWDDMFIKTCFTTVFENRVEMLRKNQQGTESKPSPNSMFNKVILLAFLLVDPSASPFWAHIQEDTKADDTPAMLDQTDGARSAKQKTLTKLLSIANAIREDVDTTLFSVERVGIAAASSLDEIDLSETEFNDPEELSKLVTKYVNLHDTLIQNLDCSGQGLAEGTKERRENCWNNFVGNKGRGKDVALFACFVIWEGKSIRWKSRRLPSDTVRSSNLDSSFSDSSDSVEDRSSKRSKKASDYQHMIAALNPKETLAQETYRKSLEVARVGLMQAQTKSAGHSSGLMEAKTKSAEQSLKIEAESHEITKKRDAIKDKSFAESHEITKVRDAIHDDKSFALLPETVQNAMLKRYADLVLGGGV
jgi:hypothetical protein